MATPSDTVILRFGVHWKTSVHLEGHLRGIVNHWVQVNWRDEEFRRYAGGSQEYIYILGQPPRCISFQENVSYYAYCPTGDKCDSLANPVYARATLRASTNTTTMDRKRGAF